jgi:hypothetical protein
MDKVQKPSNSEYYCCDDDDDDDDDEVKETAMSGVRSTLRYDEK